MRSTGRPGHQGTVADASPADDSPADDSPADDSPADDSPQPGRRASAPVLKAVCAPIKAYRTLSAARPPHCRYWPTCSAYALESVETHGVRRGLWLAGRRLARCHPWGGSGVDPVPSPRVSRGLGL